MRGEHYYLILVGKDGVKYKVYTDPITLKLMDERTTKYESKKELIETIIKNKDLDLKVTDFKDVEIWMEPVGKDKSTYTRESSPLYKKDACVLDSNIVASRFEVKIHDKDFALDFARRYKKVKNFKPISEGIEAAIRNNGDYIELIQELGEKLFKTYKGTRNIYLSMKKYDNKTKNQAPSKPVTSTTEKKEHNTSMISDEEAYIELLNYLNEYDRELLDIEDFHGYEQMSYFDEHRGKVR